MNWKCSLGHQEQEPFTRTRTHRWQAVRSNLRPSILPMNTLNHRLQGSGLGFPITAGPFCLILSLVRWKNLPPIAAFLPSAWLKTIWRTCFISWADNADFMSPPPFIFQMKSLFAPFFPIWKPLESNCMFRKGFGTKKKHHSESCGTVFITLSQNDSVARETTEGNCTIRKGSREKEALRDDSDQCALRHPQAEPWVSFIWCSLLPHHHKV